MDIEQINAGLRTPIHYRPGTSDKEVIQKVLFDRSEYVLPNCNPEIVFDVGSHIGSAAILFSLAYPNAKIYCFEPDLANFELLCANTVAYKNVKAFNLALGGFTRDCYMFESDNPLNTGGHSIKSKGINPEKSQKIRVVSISEFMKSESVDRIDFLKVDTEGSEFDILKRLFLDDKLPGHIVGEAHGVDDFKMFEMLQPTHEIGLNKHFGVRCYPFYAARKAVHGRTDKDFS